MKNLYQQLLDGEITHHDFYSQVAALAGINYEQSKDLPIIRAALDAGDEHLNTIPLHIWDKKAAATQGMIAPVMKRFGTFYSLSSGVCTHKAAAKQAAIMAEVS